MIALVLGHHGREPTVDLVDHRAIGQECSNMDDVRRWFAYFASNIISKVDPSDPNAEKTMRLARALGGTKAGASSAAEIQALGVVRSFLSLMKCWCGFGKESKSKTA